MVDLVDLVEVEIIGIIAPGVGKSAFKIPLLVWSESIHSIGVIALLIISQ